MSPGYESVIVELKRRIVALIPDHPEILELEDAWGLFNIPGFSCEDLGPTMAQADTAMSLARQEIQSREN